ncbi:MAG: glycine zipper family protein [Methylobacter sp.]
MSKLHYKKLSITPVILCFTTILPAMGQADVMVYPMQGQSNEQLSKDRYECHVWAVQQSGFDPSTAQAGQTSPQTQQKGQVLRGGARGAAAGAAIGAIAGDAGKGAAIGATAGGLKKGFERRDQKQAAQSQAAAPMPGQDAYDRAIKACLSGRNYSVN